MPLSLAYQMKLLLIKRNKLQKKQIPIIVSLASIPSRLSIVHLTILSILNQSVTPEKIILWLHEDLKSQIPLKLSKLVGPIFSIKFSTYKSSHRKLVETLKLFPDTIVVTCDDDMMYRESWLSKLYESHKKSPKKIIANQTRCISYSSTKELLPYRNWSSGATSCPNKNAILPIGASGTLYPINSLDKQVYDMKLFLELAPKADDLWFKAMALLKGTQSIQAENSVKEPIPIWGSQKISLKKTNIAEDKNRTQWLALTKHFELKL